MGRRTRRRKECREIKLGTSGWRRGALRCCGLADGMLKMIPSEYWRRLTPPYHAAAQVPKNDNNNHPCTPLPDRGEGLGVRGEAWANCDLTTLIPSPSPSGRREQETIAAV